MNSTDKIILPELLCPAGDLTRLKTAVDFGADAVYIAGEEFGMRTAASNFGEADMREGIKSAHDRGVKVHIACNTLPHNDEICRIPAFLELCQDAGADAVIAAGHPCDLAVKAECVHIHKNGFLSVVWSAFIIPRLAWKCKGCLGAIFLR